MNGIITKGGKKYFITFIDDATKYCYVYLLRTKDEALHHFKIYKAEVENQLNRKIKRLRSDRGGEYFSNEFARYCESVGIIHERTPPYSPQSNGVAERKNRTLEDLVNAMLGSSGMAAAWWGDAVLTACFVLNRVPSRNSEVTPYEGWEGRKPNLSFLRTWGCLAKVSIPLPKKRKLGPKTVDCVFLGYARHSTAYRFYVVKSETDEVTIHTVIESRDATFFENVFPMRGDSVVAPIGLSEIVSTSDRAIMAAPDVELRRSKRQRTEKSFGNNYVTYNVEDEPRTLSEAYASLDADYWKEAVRSEMDSILTNGTWEITDLPAGCKPVGCKWIFKRKMRPDGTIQKYKARLVAKGFTQKEGEDYFDTYSPVARLPTIRVLLALAAA
jgi:hypothetical protein